MSVTGWKLDDDERAELLKRFPREWPEVIADHVTLDAAADDLTSHPAAERGEIIGGINDDKGL